MIFTNCSCIRNGREDNTDERATAEKQCCSAPGCFEVTHDDARRVYQTRKSNVYLLQNNVVSGRKNGAKLLDQGTIGVWVKLFAQKLEQIVLIPAKRLMWLVSNYFH